MAEEEVHLNSMTMMMSNFSLVIYYSFLKKNKTEGKKPYKWKNSVLEKIGWKGDSLLLHILDIMFVFCVLC